MPAEITMPQLSDTMSEGTLVKWRKKEGELVGEGEVLAEVETDKATMEMEAFESGVLAVRMVKEGDKVQVGGMLAVLAREGETLEDVKKQYAGKSAGAASPAPAQPAPARARPPQLVGAAAQAPPAQGRGAGTSDTEMGFSNIEEGRAQSRRESVRTEPHHTAEQISQQAHETMSKVRQQKQQRPRPRQSGREEQRTRISPLARRIAADRGVELSQIEGSGPGGRIVQKDVLEALERPAAQAVEAPQAQGQVIPLSKMRQAIAAALQRSKSTIPHFYETVDIDMEEVVKLREQLNAALEPEKVRLSLADFISKAMAVALGRHPALNATFDGTNVTRYGDVNLGIAVALPEGLIVPVLRGLNHLGLREIRQGTVDLTERARAQRLKREEMSGATFTVSNLGQYGIREFSAIINPPEVAILAVGSAEKRAIVRDGQVVARTVMSATLSCDHRAVDGATAAEFLRALKSLLEEPGMMLL